MSPSPHLPVVCDERLSQSKLPEHLHHCLHGRLIRDGDRGHVHDLLELEWLGSAHQRVHGHLVGEVGERRADHTVLPPACVCEKRL